MLITKSFLRANKGCYSLEQLNRCSFMQREIISAQAIINSELPVEDIIWFFYNKIFDSQMKIKFLEMHVDNPWDKLMVIEDIIKDNNTTYAMIKIKENERVQTH